MRIELRVLGIRVDGSAAPQPPPRYGHPVIALERFTDPAEFLAAAGPLLAADRARSTIIATVAAGLVAAPDPAVRSTSAPLLLAVRDGGDVAAVAMRTPPHPLSVLADPRIRNRAGPIAALADAVLAAGATPALLTGPRTDVTDLAAALARGGALAPTEHMPMRLYRLGDLVEPDEVPGVARRADPTQAADRELLAAWFYEFMVETREVPRPAGPDPDMIVQRHARGNVHLVWQVDGESVALAGHSPVVGGMSRISAVYTPPDRRGNRYAAAVTAAAAHSARRAGADEVVLFTDADYAPSNAVYRRLGFEAVEEFCEMALQSAGPVRDGDVRRGGPAAEGPARPLPTT